MSEELIEAECKVCGKSISIFKYSEEVCKGRCAKILDQLNVAKAWQRMIAPYKNRD
jgi:predicted nucleic acid-binding Zn ribbon protein